MVVPRLAVVKLLVKTFMLISLPEVTFGFAIIFHDQGRNKAVAREAVALGAGL